jgi:hypothetical protein
LGFHRYGRVLKNYFEGYYSQDINRLKAISTENKIKILDAFEDANRTNLTKQQISERTGIGKNAVDNIKDSLTKEGCLTRLQKRLPTGKPSGGRSSGKSHSARVTKPA